MHDFERCYAALGVSADTDWEALRAHYRRLMSQWHPDRFPASSSERRSAEERSKRITAAYAMLDGYRRTHGVLPRIPPRPQEAVGVKPYGAGPMAAPAPGGQYTAGADGADEARRGKLPRRGWRRVTIATASLLAVFLLGYDRLDNVAPDVDRLAVAREQASAGPPIEGTPVSEGSGVFSIGSTLGDVVAIQGVPTFATGDTWHYGKSQIHFSQGRVVSWKEDPDTPLRIARNQPVRQRGGVFGVGSTKDEVREVQGAPVVEGATVWDYGLSRVYFEDNRVARWEESPVQPLRVR